MPNLFCFFFNDICNMICILLLYTYIYILCHYIIYIYMSFFGVQIYIYTYFLLIEY